MNNQHKRIPGSTDSSKLRTPHDLGQAQAKNTMEQLDKQIDKDSARIGIVVGDIFKFLTVAMTQLPDMELHTDMIHIKVDDSGILARITHPDCRDCCGFGDEPDDADDDNNYDEEGLLYDGD